MLFFGFLVAFVLFLAFLRGWLSPLLQLLLSGMSARDRSVLGIMSERWEPLSALCRKVRNRPSRRNPKVSSADLPPDGVQGAIKRLLSQRKIEIRNTDGIEEYRKLTTG